MKTAKLGYQFDLGIAVDKLGYVSEVLGTFNFSNGAGYIVHKFP